MSVVSPSPEEFPEIQLDEVVEEAAPAKPAATTTTPADIDIDLSERDAMTGSDLPSLEDPGTAKTFEPELELDMSVGPLALDTPPAVTAAPKPPGVAPKPPAPPAVSQTAPAKPSLDLDSLLSDIDLGVTKVGTSEVVDLLVGAPSAPSEEPALEVSLDDAPPLPLSADEPAPVSSVPEVAFRPSPETVAAIKRLAGGGAAPEQARAALRAALKGEPYDAGLLPPPRAMLLGMARILVGTGYSVNEMVDAIVDAMAE